jgi:hypothetical protein
MNVMGLRTLGANARRPARNDVKTRGASGELSGVGISSAPLYRSTTK